MTTKKELDLLISSMKNKTESEQIIYSLGLLAGKIDELNEKIDDQNKNISSINERIDSGKLYDPNTPISEYDLYFMNKQGKSYTNISNKTGINRSTVASAVQRVKNSQKKEFISKLSNDEITELLNTIVEVARERNIVKS